MGMEVLELFVTQPLLVKITGKMPDLSDLGMCATIGSCCCSSSH
jgi:hypothetical protein